MESAILILRKALGFTQHEMADALDCGYSTLQGYEAGRKIPADVQERANRLARQHSLDFPNMVEGPADSSAKAGRYNPEHRRWHDMLETILESKDPRALEAVKPNLVLFYAWVKKISKNFE